MLHRKKEFRRALDVASTLNTEMATVTYDLNISFDQNDILLLIEIGKNTC